MMMDAGNDMTGEATLFLPFSRETEVLEENLSNPG
jgi:hypothetical protein